MVWVELGRLESIRDKSHARGCRVLEGLRRGGDADALRRRCNNPCGRRRSGWVVRVQHPPRWRRRARADARTACRLGPQRCRIAHWPCVPRPRGVGLGKAGAKHRARLAAGDASWRSRIRNQPWTPRLRELGWGWAARTHSARDERAATPVIASDSPASSKC